MIAAIIAMMIGLHFPSLVRRSRRALAAAALAAALVAAHAMPSAMVQAPPPAPGGERLA